MFAFWSTPQKSHDLILNEIRSICATSGYEVSEAMALFTLNNILVCPKHKFYVESRDPHSDIVRITNLTVKDIISKKGIRLQLMQAQAYFSRDFGGQEQVLEEHAKLYEIYIEPLKRQILRSSPNPVMQTSPKTLFRQLVLYLVLSSGMGDPSHPDVYMEAECALASLLSQDDLLKFIRLSRFKKNIELEELNKLLVGIRLFNKIRKLGGIGVDNMPHLLTKAGASTQSILDDALSRIWNKLGPLERAVELEYEWDIHEHNTNIVSSKHKQFTNQDLIFAKELLLLWQQISYYLTTIHLYVKNHIIDLSNIKEALNKRLLSLVEHTKCKVAIETSLIYPQFKKIYSYWKTFQDLLVLHSVYNKMIRIMMQYAKVKTVPKSILKLFSKQQAIEEETQDLIDQELIVHKVIYPQKGEDYHLEFGGFCPIFALLANGLVLKAKIEIGMLKINDKLYGFRDSKAAYYFCKNPDLITRQIVDMSREKPEFIELLQLKELVLTCPFPVASAIPYQYSAMTTYDKYVQTELHPYETNIDHSYRSTTWQLKKDACQLANILKMRTKSMQTHQTDFAYDIGIQTNLPKEVETQTMSDNYTNTPKLQNYLYGLRGQREDNQHVAILTRPVEEGFYHIVN